MAARAGVSKGTLYLYFDSKEDLFRAVVQEGLVPVIEEGEALVELIAEETVTCYEGDRRRRSDWGYGCDVCPACDLRAKGYAKYKAA